jgi:hypothetical protein
LFPVLLAIHIAAGFICLVTGFLAMYARKRKGMHTKAGEIYHAAFVLILITSVAMAIMHWETNAYLLYIGIFSYAFAAVGYVAKKRRVRNWLGLHIGGMLGSYIAIITAVLVVNAPRIPVLSDINALWIWFTPTFVGTPLIFLVGRKYKRPKSV